MLQFSRNPKVAEHLRLRPRGGAGLGRFNSAATQRSRNTTLVPAVAQPGGVASIQPQPKGRGTHPARHRWPRAGPGGFNSAATQRSRNTYLHPGGSVMPESLQFSRNPKVAEHPGRRGCRSRYRRGFNSAATQRSRNTRARAAFDIEVASASIQPQPKGRGTPRTEPTNPVAAGRLQFSRNPKVAEHSTCCSRPHPRPCTLQFSRNPKVAEHRMSGSACGDTRRA